MIYNEAYNDAWYSHGMYYRPDLWLCTSTFLLQQLRLRTSTAVQHQWCLTTALVPDRNLNNVYRQWMHSNCTLVLRSSAASNLCAPGTSRTVEREEVLWRQYLLGSTLSWDCSKDRQSTRVPSFWPKESQDRSWVNNYDNRYRADGRLGLLDEPIPQSTWNHLLQANAGFGMVPVLQGCETVEAVIHLCNNGPLSQAVHALTMLAETQFQLSTSLLCKVVQRCGTEKNLVLGRRLDDLAVEIGYESDAFVGNHILRMYACQGRLLEAMKVFTRVAKPSTFMWFSILSAHTKYGKPSQAVHLYYEMRRSGLQPDNHIFAAALQACARAGDVEAGRQVHADVWESGIQPNSFVCNCLVDMYARCGELEDARRVFDSMASRDAVTWTSMINGYAENGLDQEALTLYKHMQQGGRILANSVTFACLLKVCASAGALKQGRQLHSQIVERGLLGNVVLSNCLVNMYAKCGKLGDARRVFDSLTVRNEVTWTIMINGYAECGLGEQALALYAKMEQDCLIPANRVTYSCLLKACAAAGALQQGRQLHLRLVERGLLEGDIVVGNCLVNMYARCGKLENARMVFDSMDARDTITWNAMISGYVELGFGQQALTLYARMKQDDLIHADCVTFACLLKACASAGALQQGRQLHSQIVTRGLERNSAVGNCLVNMYSKCGQLDDARMVFDRMATRTVVGWTAMISGYGTNNEGLKAIACFEEMMLAGIQPDNTTFTCLFVACSHDGLVSKGRQYFDAMVKQYGIYPTIEHYNCMVDLMGRAGYLDEAEKLLLSLGCKVDAVGLTSLLNACQNYGDLERGERCFMALLDLDSQNAAAYVLMANSYADAGRWADVDRIERLRMLAGARKKPAVAGIEVNKQVQTFFVGEERDDISCKVRSTHVRLKEDGNHVPHTKLVLKPLTEKEKEDELCGHAEKLALAYGLLNTPDGTPLLVTKNMRMCSDCHASTEIMSRVEKRNIVVRDAYRVHRFEAGSCSCKGRC